MNNYHINKAVNSKGYTLIECLVTVVLLIVLLTWGVAGYQHLIARNKTTAYLNELVAAIYYARSEALKNHMLITICKSINGQQCGGNWRDGWLIFVDPLNKKQPENPEQILRIYQALPLVDQLSWRSSLGENDVVQFNWLGNMRQDGSFIYCPQQAKQYAGAVVISLTGRVRIDKDGVDKSICR